jgi:hypothetical protein
VGPHRYRVRHYCPCRSSDVDHICAGTRDREPRGPPKGGRVPLHARGGVAGRPTVPVCYPILEWANPTGLPFAFADKSQGDPLRWDSNRWDDNVMLVTVLVPQGARMDVAVPGLSRDVVTRPTGATIAAVGEPLDSSVLAADYRSVATRAPLCPCAEAANAGRASAGFRLR